MIFFLGMTLLVLLVCVGGERGVTTFATIVINAGLLFAILYLMANGCNALVVTLVGCVLISCVTLFYQNGVNIKTKVAMVATLCMVLFMLLFVYSMIHYTKIEGFSNEQESVTRNEGYSEKIGINMTDIEAGVIIIGFIGAILDTAMAIATSSYEVHENNTHLTRGQLFLSGMNIGKDILGTTINTLFFAFFGEFLMLMIFFMHEYTFTQVINSDLLAQELIRILFSGIGCIAIIPLTAIISAYAYCKNNAIISDKN